MKDLVPRNPEIYHNTNLPMTPHQRRLHRIIWLILAVVLPTLFLLEVLHIPKPVYQKQLYQQSAAAINPDTTKSTLHE